MPKSRRDKKISLTKTKKKGLPMKQDLIQKVRENVGKHKNLFIFSYENLRTNHMRLIREKFKDNSRMFLGNTKVIGVALGRTSQEEVSENLHLMSQRLVGNRGLFFTNLESKEILEYFDSINIPDFARAGNIAPETYQLEEGLLKQFPHNMEPHLRKIGLPVEMNNQYIHLKQNYTVCEKGKALTADQAKILKLFGEKMAAFKICVEYQWSEDGAFEDLGRAHGIKLRQKSVPEVPVKANSDGEAEETMDED